MWTLILGYLLQNSYSIYEVQAGAACDVLWWQRNKFETDNSERRQFEFNLNGPNEEWTNDGHSLNGATPRNSWGG